MRLVIAMLLAMIVLLAIAGWGDIPDNQTAPVPVDEPDQLSTLE